MKKEINSETAKSDEEEEMNEETTRAECVKRWCWPIYSSKGIKYTEKQRMSKKREVREAVGD